MAYVCGAARLANATKERIRLLTKCTGSVVELDCERPTKVVELNFRNGG